jgi:type IV fimbrial biogenesis protein FimT
MCPIGKDNRCIRDWSLPIVVFRDPERSAKISDEAQVIRVRQTESKGTLKGATGIHSYFRFNPSGFAWGAIGNITWCPQNDDPTLATQIRINMGGRPKLAKDRDNDGIVEDSRGKPITCH